MGTNSVENLVSDEYEIEMKVLEGKFITTLEIDYFNLSSNTKVGKATVQILNLDVTKVSLREYLQELLSYPNDKKNHLGDVRDILSVLSTNELKRTDKVALINHVELFEEYRGKKLANRFVWFILKGIKENFDLNYVLLEACPAKFSGDVLSFKKELQRLEKIYTKSGFQLIKERQLLLNNEIFVHFMYNDLSNKSFTNYAS